MGLFGDTGFFHIECDGVSGGFGVTITGFPEDPPPPPHPPPPPGQLIMGVTGVGTGTGTITF